MRGKADSISVRKVAAQRRGRGKLFLNGGPSHRGTDAFKQKMTFALSSSDIAAIMCDRARSTKNQPAVCGAMAEQLIAGINDTSKATNMVTSAGRGLCTAAAAAVVWFLGGGCQSLVRREIKLCRSVFSRRRLPLFRRLH